VESTQNTSTHIGLISNSQLEENYYLKATISSTDTGDNDRIGLVLAFVEDSTKMTPNNAYGLNPDDFDWPIDTINEFIPHQHTLTVFRNREITPTNPSFFVAYNYSKQGSRIISVND